MASGGQNTMQWGQTATLPTAIAEHVEEYIKAHASGDAKRTAAALAVLEALLASDVTATVKLDGTNVGKETTGALVGRRFRIGDEQETYQDTDVAMARAVDAVKVSQLLAAETNIEIGKLLVYGELLCNDIYRYAAEGLCGTYRAFGLAFEPASGSANSVAAALNAQGWAASAAFREEDGATTLVRVSANRRLLDLLSRAGVPTVEVVGGGLSLMGLVAALAPRMLEQDLEGLVLTLQTPGASRRLKWKISAEQQPSCVAHLAALTDHFEAYPAVAAAMPDGLPDMIRTLRAVATAPLSESFRESTFRKNPEKYAVDAGEADATVAMQAQVGLSLARSSGMRAAMHSALSKFDSLDAFFAGGEKPPRVAERVLAEMAADLGELGLDATAARAAVTVHVGKAFGAWKQKQAGLENRDRS